MIYDFQRRLLKHQNTVYFSSLAVKIIVGRKRPMHLICAIGVLLNCTSQFNLLMLQSKFSTSGFMKERKKKRKTLHREEGIDKHKNGKRGTSSIFSCCSDEQQQIAASASFRSPLIYRGRPAGTSVPPV